MLIKGFCTPTSTEEGTPTHQSIQLIIKSPKDLKTRHQRNPLIGLHHLQRQQRCILLLIALILLQQVEVHTCYRLSHRSSKRLSSVDEIASASSAAIESENINSPKDKRAELIHGAGVGQPEEIFTVDDGIESNYDEYPMIVPKRAALLLDRLMVALHHALEKEHYQQRRIGELNENTNNGDEFALNEDIKSNDQGVELQKGAKYVDNMYGDDPMVLTDYDFKDLNSINRATGETLMGKSFQRRANIGGADTMALLSSGGVMKGANIGLINGASSGGGGGSIGGGRISKGRMYWRCYFNAVSCF